MAVACVRDGYGPVGFIRKTFLTRYEAIDNNNNLGAILRENRLPNQLTTAVPRMYIMCIFVDTDDTYKK